MVGLVLFGALAVVVYQSAQNKETGPSKASDKSPEVGSSATNGSLKLQGSDLKVGIPGQYKTNDPLLVESPLERFVLFHTREGLVRLGPNSRARLAPGITMENDQNKSFLFSFDGTQIWNTGESVKGG